jgi:LPXTG-site transpeptidase (sortase) family protein
VNLKLVLAGAALLAAAGAAQYLHLGEVQARVHLPDTPITRLLDTPDEEPAGSQPPTGMHLQLPAIGVDAPVDELPPGPDGRLQAPTNWADVGWFSGGPRPGQAGSALLMGHVDSHTGPAVFWNLHQLRPGDAVLVQDGAAAFTYRVSKALSFPETAPPMDDLFARTGASRLLLLTCSGDFNPRTGRYTDRLLVEAEPA